MATFGSSFTTHMLRSTYKNSKWSEFQVTPLTPFVLHPAAIVLHYCQSIFEGMKAYKQPDGTVNLFRPEMNIKRLNRSAARVAMPQLDERSLLNAIAEFVDTERNWVPDRPGALYIRPAMFASEAAIGVRSGTECEFFVIAMPVESYFSGPAESSTISLFVSESVKRAAPGGTGAVKAGANYAITLQIIDHAKSLGCEQVLFLDAMGRGTLEECGGMNVFIIRDGCLVTPPLSDTILAGVTRDSILQLAEARGILCKQEPILLSELADGLRRGNVSEVFVCGTAATIVAVDALHFEDGNVLEVGASGNSPISRDLYRSLLDIQYGETADNYDWRYAVSR
jgi:branched-chain amino acid aminotransferase